MSGYAAAFSTAARRALRNPAPLIARVLMYLVILGVLSALWHAAIAPRGAIAGYDFKAMLWYLTIAEASVICIDPRLIEQVGGAVGDGSVTVEMLRPISVVGFRVAATLGECFARFAIVVVAGGAFAAFRVGGPPNPGSLLLALPAALVAITANVTAQHAFAAMAFWAHDSKAAWFLYQKLVFLLGGMLLPLELVPHALYVVARVLPFWTMSYVPARIASGHVEPFLLVVQIAWAGALAWFAAAAFGAGQRRVAVAGG